MFALRSLSFDENKLAWMLTFSFIDNRVTMTRGYKTFTVDAYTGDVKSMKIRNPFAKS